MTLNDVILRHGGEAQAARDSFAALNAVQQNALITFLNSLVLSRPTIRRRTSIREIPASRTSRSSGTAASSLRYCLTIPQTRTVASPALSLRVRHLLDARD
jgi:hypothetical protein